MAVAQPYGFKIDFVRNPISESAAWFFVVILKFIFTPIFEIKIYEKKFLDTQKISFSKPDFHKHDWLDYVTLTASILRNNKFCFYLARRN